MGLERWTQVSEERVLDFRMFQVRTARRTSPRTGKDRDFFLLDTPDWVNVVALTRREELVLVRQYRHGTEDFTLEIPGGLIDPGEDPSDTARRELREESGYRAGEVVEIGRCAPNPAYQSNTLITFLATGCEYEGELIQDHGEDIEVVLVPVAEIEDRVRRGEISHALVLAGLFFYKLRG